MRSGTRATIDSKRVWALYSIHKLSRKVIAERFGANPGTIDHIIHRRQTAEKLAWHLYEEGYTAPEIARLSELALSEVESIIAREKKKGAEAP